MIRCERSDLLVEQCGCPDHRGAALAANRETFLTSEGRVTFPAKYVGLCRHCECIIEVGQEIYRLKDEGYVHEDCDSEDLW